MSFKITLQPENVEIEASPGESLLEVAARANIQINASCAGEGVCGRCRVELLAGELDNPSGPGAFLSADEYAAGWRLACRSFVLDSATVFIPPDSRAETSLYAASTLVEAEVTVENRNPLATELEITLNEPSVGDNIADCDRLNDYLAANCDLTLPHINVSVLKELPKALRANDFNIGLTVFEHPGGAKEITALRSGPKTESLYALAIDIGTTTVWGRLVNLETGENGLAQGELNGQVAFGEDVISRLIFAGKGDGLARLQGLVVENINSLIEELTKEEPALRSRIAQVVVAGNTTMSHLFTAVDPNFIRRSPYVPAVAAWPILKAADINGLALPGATPILLYPSISSYVGGDIIAGVLASELYKKPELTLFIDIGTNGEIVIGNQDWLTCAACSAGPAFEGGGVKFGMRAAPGAIDQFFYDQQTKSHRLNILGGEKALGICGSGLINIAAELFMAGLLDPQGKLVIEAAPALIREGEDGLEYILVPAQEAAAGRDIVLTEIDIENLIRAKGAMYSGYQTLLESVGLTMADLEKVIIGGGFGKSLNLQNAITIGLLPELPVEKFAYLGNTSLAGSTLAALSSDLWQKASDIKANMTNFELSDTPGYMDYYLASQFLPHTEAGLFPETTARLKRKS